MMGIPATGMKRGNWTLIAAIEGHENVWLCRCICGRHLPLKVTRLRRRPPRSCGCHFWEYWEDDPPPIFGRDLRRWRVIYNQMRIDFAGRIDGRWLGRGHGFRRWQRDVSPVREKPWYIDLMRGQEVIGRDTFIWRDSRQQILRRRIGQLKAWSVVAPEEYGFFRCRCICGREVIRSYDYLMTHRDNAACSDRCRPQWYDSGNITFSHVSDITGAPTNFLKKFVARGNELEEVIQCWEVRRKKIPAAIDKAKRRNARRAARRAERQ